MIDLILITFTLVVFLAGFFLGRSWERIKHAAAASYGRLSRALSRAKNQ